MPQPSLRQLRTASEVIDIAGGVTAVGRMFGVSPQAVGNWRQRGLPAHTYSALSKFLIARGYSAPPTVWRLAWLRQSDLAE